MKTRLISTLAIALMAVFTVGCSDDNDSEMEQGQVNVKMTDAPSDDANIEGTFITVSSVKIDGQEVDNFQKQTIDISAYQEGETKLLVSDQVEAKSYNSISIELDYETDASGNSPGCYVLTSDNMKHDLSAESDIKTQFLLNEAFTVDANQSTDIVIDFDLRKAIQRDEANSERDYKFVSEMDIQSSLRLVLENETGDIQGEVNNSSSADVELFVYAYKKGSYNFVTETQGQGSGDVMFSNAVTSAKVKDNGTYHLAFLEEGDYEIHIASYTRGEADGELSFTGMANAVSSIPALLLDNISVSSSQTVTLNMTVSVSS